MSGKWNETETYKEIFYNNAKNKILSDVLDEIHKIPFHSIPKGKQPKGKPTTNGELGRILKELGWGGQYIFENGSFRLDNFKKGVGLEREFRTIRDLVYDVLKFQHGYDLKDSTKITSGVIITYDKKALDTFGGYLKYNDACLQALDRKIGEFQEVINFNIPLLVIGLKETSLRQGVPERHVRYPAALRGPSYQRYLEKLRRERALERAKK